MVQSEGDMSLKNLVTPLGIDPMTVQLVVQRLSHYAAPDPTLDMYSILLSFMVTYCSIHHAYW